MNDIDSVIREMYESVSFEKGERPDWRRCAAIFVPGAPMVRINDSGVYEFRDQATYQRDFDRMIDSGEMPSCWEGELWRETRCTRDGERMNAGVNSIQLFRRDGQWWISAMIWRREGRDVRIPESPKELV
jgi:hypothetical protein